VRAASSSAETSTPLHSQRMVVLGAAAGAMVIAALIVWFAIGAMPDVAKSLPIERVVFASATGAPLTEVDGEALKRLADALQTRGASMLQVDLVALAAMVKQVPWVREATIRRQFPSTIVVAIEEHKPVAQWTPDGIVAAANNENSTLVDSYGDVFSAVISDERREQLPRLAGPDGSSVEVLTRYASLLAPLKSIDRAPKALVLTPRRAWQLTLDNGSAVELGRADVDERLSRFIRSYAELPALQTAGATIDMRYQSGLTIRNTGLSAAANKPSQSNKPSKSDVARKRTA
jgi:cell division protein FtsQ